MFDIQKQEKKVLNFWRREDVFQRGIKKNKKNPKFIFYEGPPGANGRPGLHHVLSRSYKDIVCRYKAMKGFYVERKSWLGYAWFASRVGS